MDASRRSLLDIVLIMAIALAVRLWVVSHTEVAARDSIGFIRYAINLESPPEGQSRVDVLKAERHPPGYVACVMLVSWPVRAVLGTTADAMVLSSQLVSVIASVFLVLPLYQLIRLLTDRNAALLGTLFFQLLPVCVQITSDGLSDGLFLLTAASTLWFGAIAFTKMSLGWWLLCGLGSGCAYWIRPEGLILAGAIGGTVLLHSRGKIRSLFGLTLGVLLLVVPYVALTGKLTNKTTGNDLLKVLSGEEAQPTWKVNPIEKESSRGPAKHLFAAWWHPELNQGQSKILWACKALGSEVLKTSHYIGALLFVLGFGQLRRRVRQESALLQLLVLMALQTGLLWFMAYWVGYVSERHTLLIVLAGSLFVGVALRELSQRLDPRWLFGSTPLISVICLLLSITLPGSLKSLHKNRAGHHAAGLWLAEHAQPEDVIWDPFMWAEFYAGRSMYIDPDRNYHRGPVYVVLEPLNENPHSKLPMIPMAKQLVQNGGEVVFHWPTDQPKEKAKVLVYRCPPLPFQP